MERRGVREGLAVVGADGAEVGEVSVCGEQHFLIEERSKRLFRPDRVARYDQVARVEEGVVHLAVPADAVPYGMDFRKEDTHTLRD